jgi:hypothetical protein
LSNPSAYVCGEACALVYQTLGIADRFGFNVDGGHSHCAFPSDQESDLRYFLNKFMKGTNSLSQIIRTAPGSYSIIKYTNWTAWWGTTNAVIPAPPIFQLSIPSVATEGDGTLVGRGSLVVGPAPAEDLTVSLTSSNTGKVTVPTSVIIPAGQTNAVFDLTIIDNSLLDGDQLVIITATTSIFTNAPQARITVHDNETTTLSVGLPASASNSAGTLVNAGSVSMGAAAGANVTISLSSGDPSRMAVPSTTVISNGQTSAMFNITLVNNHAIDGPHNVSVTAHVPNWADGSASMTVFNDNPLPDHFAWSVVSSPQLAGEPFPVTIIAQDAANNTLDFDLPIAIDALAPGAAGTNTLLKSPSPEETNFDGAEYTLGYAFTPTNNLAVTQVRSYFGDKISIWNDSGSLLASQNVVSVPGTWVDTSLSVPLVLVAGTTYRVTAHENNVDFYSSDDLPGTFANGTINQSWWDGGDMFPATSDNARWYFVDLRYGTNFSAVPVSPVLSGNFTNGIWSGNLAVLQPASGVALRASAGTGHDILSLGFNVIGLPKLAIVVVGNSIVLSWPTASAGFTLQQTSDLSHWSNVPLTPAVVGNNYNVTNNIDPGGVYYRLQDP